MHPKCLRHTLTLQLLWQVHGEASQLHSQLKVDIRVQVQVLKTLFPNGLKGSPQELQSGIRDRVQKLIDRGAYLHGIDPDTVCSPPTPNLRFTSHTSQGKQAHFAHPIITSTAQSFYFDKWHAISTCDRDTFAGSVPRPLIALIGTVVSFFAML